MRRRRDAVRWRGLSTFTSAGLVLGAGALGAIAFGCDARTEIVTSLVDAGSDAAVVPEAGPPPLETSNKIDLLFVIDDSPNTEAFQALLAATAPYMLGRFGRPACVNGLGNVVAETPSPSEPCPVGEREFAPIDDVHVGVITTSLGASGADTCSPALSSWNPTQNDAGRLITRGPGGSTVATWNDKGFLAWDPEQKLQPAGDADAGALAQGFADLAVGAGAVGCGFEASLESMYRFLVDPEPYASISLVNGTATPVGTDATLLQQRSDFLRPDSALVVVLITDEDDCSVKVGNEFYLALQSLYPGMASEAFHLPPPRTVCASAPDDPCCASCAQPTPAGCPPDPACQASALSPAADPINLRCFDQKRRFGVDFMYPVQRYVDGLTSSTVTARDGSVVANPLYVGNRSPKLVMMAGILGVPWQDLAITPKNLSTGYQAASAIDWALLLGDPDAGTLATDPLMVKSIAPRSGSNPPTGDPLAGPDGGQLANPINGHERLVAESDDLQYACVYRRPTPIACALPPCNCVPPDVDGNPVCQAADGSYSATEVFARALPSTRPLEVLRGLGDRATVASVCATEIADAGSPIFAYSPAVDAIFRTLRPRIRP